MKKITLLFILPLVMLVGFTNCGDDDDQLIDLPTTINDYLAANYPDYSIDESEEGTLCDGTIVYEVELEDSNDNEIELTFNTEGSLLFSETEIENSELPSAVTSSISTNYPDYSTDEAERIDMADGSTRYEVELENGDSELDVLFEADGTVICEETDDD